MNPTSLSGRRGLLSFGVLMLAVIAPSILFSAIAERGSPTSKLFVTEVQGEAQITTGGKIEKLTEKSVFTAQGTIIETKKATSEQERDKVFSSLVYSNGTGVHLDPDTRIEILRFVQEPFVPNRTDLEMEPSISQTITFLSRGTVALCLGKLAAGSLMIYQTPHCSINIRGRRIVIETNDKFTRVAMLEGDSTVRGGRGSQIEIGGEVINAGHQAIVEPATVGQTPTVRIEPIPEENVSVLEQKAALACMARRTVYFDETASGDIVPVATIPADIPIQFTVSPAQLDSGG